MYAAIKDHPDHHDAELVLKLYDLRRESLMRASRSAMTQWFPKTFDDVLAITKADHPSNAAFRQVSGYWEMAFGMARQGVIHPEFLAENSGEGLWFYARLERFLEEFRAISSPRAFRNAEWIVANTAMGREMMPTYRARIEKLVAAT
ncbi:MAG: hypothetical protein ACHQQ3_02330 [Gemmatimonadales bacterium]